MNLAFTFLDQCRDICRGGGGRSGELGAVGVQGSRRREGGKRDFQGEWKWEEL